MKKSPSRILQVSCLYIDLYFLESQALEQFKELFSLEMLINKAAVVHELQGGPHIPYFLMSMALCDPLP